MSERATSAVAWQARLRAAGLENLEYLLADGRMPDHVAGGWELLTKPGLGVRERWRWALNGPDQVHVLYVKRYRESGLKQQLDRMLRQFAFHSRAWWEFQQSQRLNAAGVAAPPAVGCVERMRGPFEARSAVLLEQVPGDGFDRAWVAAARAQASVTRGLARHVDNDRYALARRRRDSVDQDAGVDDDIVGGYIAASHQGGGDGGNCNAR